MGCCSIQTVMCWSVCGDLAVVEFFRGDDHYVFGATAKTLQGSLRLVGQCAANPELSLTFIDAAAITQALRQITPSSPAEVEPAVDEWVDGDECISDCAGSIGLLLAFSAAFWVGVFYLIWRVVA